MVWGGWHGILLVLDRYVEPWSCRLSLMLRRLGTFVLIVLSWVLFRSTSFAMATDWLSHMTGLASGPDTPPAALLAWIIAAFIAVNVLPETWDFTFPPRRRWAIAYAAVFFVAYLFMNGNHTVFLYYQF